MKAKDVLAMLMTRLPDRSIAVTVQQWYHGTVVAGPFVEKPVFVVSVLPGFDGSKCNRFEGESFDACVKLVIEADRNAFAARCRLAGEAAILAQSVAADVDANDAFDESVDMELPTTPVLEATAEICAAEVASAWKQAAEEL